MVKKICIIIMIIVCANVFAINSYAARPEDTGHEETGETTGQVTNPILDPDAYEPSANLKSDNEKFIGLGNTVLGAIRLVGTAISVITLMTLGIRYMMGSSSDKALYKETMGPYVIGAVMLFAIPNLIVIIYDLVTNNIKIGN